MKCNLCLNEGLDIGEIKKIVYQLLLALCYCHGLNVIHRDVKPDNVLMSSRGVVKLCDFGFARVMKSTQKLTEYVSTRWYRAPELLANEGNYSYPVDVWSVGCLCAELLTGKPLFPGNNDTDMLARITRYCGNLTENLSNELKNFTHFQSLDVCVNQQRSQDIHTKP
jgi:cyclin-dependent kinase-like